jgi:pSer/pThr/pTyr-binding forkhead associated (FHA) protein
MDVGLVCDRCSTASAMGTPHCLRCGEALSLETEPQGAPEGSAPVLRPPTPVEAETRVGAPSLRAPAPPDPSAAIDCGECGAAIPPGQRFCGNCGARVDPNRRNQSSPAEKVGRSTLFFGAIQGARARLTVISGEGHDGVTFTLAGTDHLAGRIDCPILFPDDPYLSPVHANFFYRGNHLVVRDEGSVNGVYVRMLGTVTVDDGAHVMVGEQILELGVAPEVTDAPDPDGTYFFASPGRGRALRVAQPLRGGGVGLVRIEPTNRVRVGREGNDLDFPEDPFISGHHALIELDGERLTVSDLSSKNGTFLRIRGEQTLAHGDYVFMGQQLLRVEIV